MFSEDAQSVDNTRQCQRWAAKDFARVIVSQRLTEGNAAKPSGLSRDLYLLSILVNRDVNHFRFGNSNFNSGSYSFRFNDDAHRN